MPVDPSSATLFPSRVDGNEMTLPARHKPGHEAVLARVGDFVVLRKIGIRSYTWLNFIYPFSG